MPTLKIKGVDLNKLERQRKEVNELIDCMPVLTGSDGLMGIMNMLDYWSDERYHESLGSKENQKAKARQLSLPWYICPQCDKEQPHTSCIYCGSATTKTEFVE